MNNNVVSTIEWIYLSLNTKLKDNQLYEYFIDYFMFFQRVWNDHRFVTKDSVPPFFWILSKKRTQRPPYVECRTLSQHNTTLAARTKKTSKGKTTERERGGRRREREGMCRYIHILIEKRRERGWLSMRGVVAPPPPSNDQAETTFGVADPHTHTSFSASILPPPHSFPIPLPPKFEPSQPPLVPQK